MAPRLLLSLLFLTLLLPSSIRANDLFRDRIAPLLESRCLVCHDSLKKRGGLDLSTKAGLLAGGDQGAVIVPRQPARSRLIQMVSGAKPRMPRVGARLTEAEVSLLSQWIAEGAVFPEGKTLQSRGGPTEEKIWWAFRPLQRPPLPEITDHRWARTPIDRFLLAALEQRKLHPAPEADRQTLLRRVTFDLTGLPPTPEEMDAFLNDSRADAYERVVERLLGSPAYGERWGRHWLDVAHYGDTHGYDKDKRRDHAWRYRDWVIRQLNADLDYRSFVREQLAGDVLRPGDPEGIIATGFVVAGPWDFVGQVELREGTVDKEKTRLLDRDDMVSSTLGAITSLTVGCARCHDHKFDPISTREYYRLQAIFAGVERGARALPEGTSKTRQELLAQQKRLSAARAEVVQKIDKAIGAALASLDARLQELRKERGEHKLPPSPPSPSNGWHSSISVQADAVRWVQVDLGRVQALEEVRLFPARPTDFRDAPGFGFPVRFKIELAEEPTFARPIVVADHTGEDYPSPGDTIYSRSLKRQKARYLRVTATKLWKRLDDYVFALAELQVDAAGKNVAAGKVVTSLDSIEAGRWSRRYLVDGFTSREKLPELSDPQLGHAFRERIRLTQRIRELEQQRTREAARWTPPTLTRQLNQLDAERREVEEKLRLLPQGPMTYAVLPISPRPIWELKRGDVEQKKEQVTPGGLSCIPGLSSEFALEGQEEGARRLALANWLTEERHVLTWRSIANRIWHYHFGKGLVDTPSDFGKMGSLPSHPELLDWLACEVRQTPSLKHLHRLIVTSAAYRQSSRHEERFARIDADNRFLWRMNRLRLDAESIRDAVLAVSGQLDRRMGGPGFELFRFKDDHSPVYDHTGLAKIHDPATYRRTVYRFTVRSVPNPFLDCMDSADPNQATPVRNTTLTALQALALRNNPFMVRQASHFAQRLQGLRSTLEQQVTEAYRLAFGRGPTKEETAAVVAHARQYGLAAACRVLFNTNEFVFVD